MIPRAYISEWREHAPWGQDAWVEQDLVLSRAIVDMFRVDDLARRLAFRGGTALYKLHVHPAARYSEDIDLVQTQPEPIGGTIDSVRRVLDPWLGAPRRVFKEGRINLVYRFPSEEDPPTSRRVKIKINSREHFTEVGLLRLPYAVESRWFDGKADVTTFRVEELLSTKLRALYQRKKGRDLFDLWIALMQGVADPTKVIACFRRSMGEGGHAVTRAQFEANLQRKAAEPEFRGDIVPLIRTGLSWDFDDALSRVLGDLVRRLPVDP